MRKLITLITTVSMAFIFSATGLGATLTVPGQFPTIQQAINASANYDEVWVAPGTYTENIDYKGQLIWIRGTGGASVTVIDGSGAQDSVVTFNSGETYNAILDGFTIENGSGKLVFKNGALALYGGGIYCDGVYPDIPGAYPQIFNCIIKNNFPYRTGPELYDVFGGGIYLWRHKEANPNGTAFIVDCIIEDNQAGYTEITSGYGGGIAAHNGAPQILECIIRDNTAFGMMGTSVLQDPTAGGGIYMAYWPTHFGAPSIADCNISYNSTNGWGGGCYFLHCDGIMSRCTVDHNQAYEDSVSAGRNGGGVACVSTDDLFDKSMTFMDCNIWSNLANWNGGGMYIYNCEPTIMSEETDKLKGDGTVISDNAAGHPDGEGWGGGIYAEKSAYVMRDSYVWGNTAENGGGVYLDNESGPFHYTSDFYANSTSGGHGGAVYLWNSTALFKRCFFRANHAGGDVYDSYGGAIYTHSQLEVKKVVLRNCMLFRNNLDYTFHPDAKVYGGGIYCSNKGGALIKNCTLSDNFAHYGGGVNINTSEWNTLLVTIVNSILWDQYGPPPQQQILTSYSANVAVSYSDVQGGWTGTGNINADPLFFFAPGDFENIKAYDKYNYHLTQDSPCINVGNNNDPDLLNWDIDSDPRIIGPLTNTVDMGADEFVLISASNGGSSVFHLDAGPANANRNYLLLGSANGYDQGIVLPGGEITLPLNWDWYTNLILQNLNSWSFSDFLGVLDGSGRATTPARPRLRIKSLNPSAVGLVMWYAFCCDNPYDYGSNVVKIIQISLP